MSGWVRKGDSVLCIWSLTPFSSTVPFYAFLSAWTEQLASATPFYHSDSALETTGHELKPRKPWVKLNVSSFKLCMMHIVPHWYKSGPIHSGWIVSIQQCDKEILPLCRANSHYIWKITWNFETFPPSQTVYDSILYPWLYSCHIQLNYSYVPKEKSYCACMCACLCLYASVNISVNMYRCSYKHKHLIKLAFSEFCNISLQFCE